MRIDDTPRKDWYGSGKQPWDTIKEFGWFPYFAASNVLKYLRRIKDVDHSVESAKVYYKELLKYREQEDPLGSQILLKLQKELTDDELNILEG